jgi:hypothetical protein
MDRNLAKPLIAVIAATVGLGIWQYARASSAPAPQAAQVTQIDGGSMPADHASHHMANAGSANIFTGTLPYMGAMTNSAGADAMMKSGDMSAMMNSGGTSAMMKSGDMSAMMNSGDMSAMMNSASMSAMMDSAGMSAADKQECLESAGNAAKMQAHMAQMSQVPGHMQPGTEPAK